MEDRQPEVNARATAIAATWAADRDYLFMIASRILGDGGEADDVVAEAFARLAAQPDGAVRDPRGWLIVVVRRLAIDHLRSAHRRLSEPVDPAQPWREPAPPEIGGVDPADRVTLDDELRRALSVVVGRLSLGERAAFVLHDVFGIPFDEVGELVGRSPAACRKLASRARAVLRTTDPLAVDRTPPRERELDRVARCFTAACADGDVAGFAALLHEEVSGWAVRDGVVLGEAHGREAASVGLAAFFGPRSRWEIVPFALDDPSAVLVTRAGAPGGLMWLTTDDDGAITALRAVLFDDATASDRGTP